MQEIQETQVQYLGWEDPPEEDMATHSTILGWRIPWTEEPGGQWTEESMGSQKVRHDWRDLAHEQDMKQNPQNTTSKLTGGSTLQQNCMWLDSPEWKKKKNHSNSIRRLDGAQKRNTEMTPKSQTQPFDSIVSQSQVPSTCLAALLIWSQLCCL